MKRYTQDGYWREIEMKDGALTIETRLSGQCRYRLPVVWIGGVFGAIRVGNNVIPAARPFDEINVREITLIGGPYPNWVVRFDHPVMVSYSPIRGLVHMHPLRYFNVASGVLDIIMSDRLHMAWRVEE